MCVCACVAPCVSMHVHSEYVCGKAGGMVAGYPIQIHTDPVQAL